MSKEPLLSSQVAWKIAQHVKGNNSDYYSTKEGLMELESIISCHYAAVCQTREIPATPPDFTEQSRQLLYGLFGLYGETDALLRTQRRIASALAEAATQGQAIAFERAAEICQARKIELEGAFDIDVDARVYRHDEAWQLLNEIRALSPDPNFIDRVCNEAVASLENRSHQTVFFGCGCMFRQDGLDAEPSFKYCKAHDATAAPEQAADEIGY